jgi:hypothetical protein
MTTTMGAGTAPGSTDESVTTGNWTVTGDLTAKTGRTSTYTIAASDAPAHVKAQADVTASATEANVAIQAAITAGYKNIYLTEGSFPFGAPVVAEKISSVKLTGSGDATILSMATGVNDAFFKIGNFAGGNGGSINWEIAYLHFEGNSANTGTSAHGIVGSILHKSRIHDIWFNDFAGNPIKLSGQASPLGMSLGNTFRTIRIDGLTADSTQSAVLLDQYVADDLWDDIIMEANGVGHPYMFYLVGTYTEKFTHIYCGTPTSVGFYGRDVQRISITDSIFGGSVPASTNWIKIDATDANVDGILIRDNIFRSGVPNGVVDVKFSAGAGRTFANSDVSGNYADHSLSDTWGYGFYSDGAGTHSKITVHDNNWYSVANPVTAAAGVVVYKNQGWVTENSGLASDVTLDGSGVGVIAHGCAITPTYANVICKTGNYNISVTSIDATNINITVLDLAGSAVTADTHDFYWEAK